MLFVILVSYINPAVNFVDAWRDSHAQRSAAAAAPSTSTAGWRPRPPSLDDPGAAAEAARKLGMVAPGERSYVVKRPALSASGATAPAPVEAPG